MANIPERGSKKTTNLVRYTGLAFQMIATIGLFCFIGYKIDESSNNKNNLWMALLGLIGVFLALYQVVRAARKGG